MSKNIISLVRRNRRSTTNGTGRFAAACILAVTLAGIALLLVPYRVEIKSPDDGGQSVETSNSEMRSAGSAAAEERTGIERFLPLPHEVVAGCIALMGIAICFVDRRVRNARPKFGRRRGDLMEPESDPYDEASRNRLAQKRLRILGTLVNDNHKLLPSDLTVGDLMTTVVRTACPLTTIAELRAMTIEYKIRHILVCNDDNELVGVVSDRDLRRVSLKLVASDLMAECPTTVSSDMLVNQAITVLLYGHISSLPVVDAGRLVGIITTTDVVMTLQCAMLAVEQMVRDLGAGNRPASATYSES